MRLERFIYAIKYNHISKIVCMLVGPRHFLIAGDDAGENCEFFLSATLLYADELVNQIDKIETMAWITQTNN